MVLNISSFFIVEYEIKIGDYVKLLFFVGACMLDFFFKDAQFIPILCRYGQGQGQSD